MIAHDEIHESNARFDQYVSLLAEAAGHADRHDPLRDYCVGLLISETGKNVESMAARISPANVRSKHQSLHHLVADAPWSDKEVLNTVRQYVLPRLNLKAPELSWIVDETGLPKKGRASVGVQRQYCREVGDTENCQVAVSLSLATEEASLPLAYQLYLPASWAHNVQRREKVKVPEEITFLTKPKIALQQVEAMMRAKVPKGLVNGDAVYGNSVEFREGVTNFGLKYALGIHGTTTVWPPGAKPRPPATWKGVGRPPTRLRRDPDNKPISANELALQLKAKFRTVTWREGATGKMASRFCAVRVRAARNDEKRKAPRPEEWLLIEWPEGEKVPTKYWLSTLPKSTSLRRLVARTKLRWRIERDYQELKQEVGLGDYQGRGWRGFHHHATLCIAAYAFLISERLFFPSGDIDPRRRFQVPSVPRGFRPRGASDTA